MTRPPLHRLTLANGLRVLLAPDSSFSAVGASVHYGVGFRSEPGDRSGLAHAFEHMMFQGSRNVGKGEHVRYVQEAGGICEAHTRQDCTVYHSAVPSAALDLLLFLEADRMRSPLLTRENLENQKAVIREEIRLNIHDRPYGGFPWVLPRVMYDAVENKRDGYGEDADLESLTVSACHDFFSAYYSPGNAVLTLTGAFDPAEAERLARRHFGDVPARPVPALGTPREKPLRGEIRHRTEDRAAALPAVAVGYRLPDPVRERTPYLAHVALVAMLAESRGGPLRTRLQEVEPNTVGLSMRCGLFGSPFDARDPDLITVLAVHEAEGDPEAVCAALDSSLGDMADNGPDPVRLERVMTKWACTQRRESGDPRTRARLLGGAELLHGEAELADDLPDLVRTAASAAHIGAAARALRSGGRAVVTIEPTGRRLPTGAQ